jgi:hypothetical protein
MEPSFAQRTGKTVREVVMFALVLAIVGTFAAFSTRAHAQAGERNSPSAPNALDVQDRQRDLARERTHNDVRARLGDHDRQPDRHQGFGSPRTDDKPDVPDTTPSPSLNR